MLSANPLTLLGQTVMGAAKLPARLPVIGRHLEPIASVAALGMFAARVAPEYARDMTRPRRGPRRSRFDDTQKPDRGTLQAQRRSALVRALRDLDPDSSPTFGGDLAAATKPTGHRRLARGVRYASGRGGPRLDVWGPAEGPVEGAPVLVFVPGGAWIYGNRIGQGGALVERLASAGWICVTMDYRVAPHHPWPAHILDVKRCLAWVEEHIDSYGGDPTRVSISGASAGGHLASLAGLTWDDPTFGTTMPLQAVVGLYGRYDWESRDTDERKRFMAFLENVVVERTQAEAPEVFRAASPTAQIRPDAPPFLVVHGDSDSIIPVEQGAAFAERLSRVSTSPVFYAELPGAGHGFDMLDPVTGRDTAAAAERFLTAVDQASAVDRSGSSRTGTADIRGIRAT